MVAAEWAESLDFLVAGFAGGLAGDVIERALGVDRVVENDRVDDQAERAELFFLAVVVGLAELAAAAVADVAGEAVAAFAAVELREDAPAEVRLRVGVLLQLVSVDQIAGKLGITNAQAIQTFNLQPILDIIAAGQHSAS